MQFAPAGMAAAAAASGGAGRASNNMLDVLVKLVFVDNAGRCIDLELPTLDDGRGLFMFCLDLLSRGMMVMAGSRWDDPLVDLRRLSRSHFERAAAKLRCLGVEAELRCEACEQVPRDQTLLMLACQGAGGGPVAVDARDIPLSSSRAMLVMDSRAYSLTFRTFHYCGAALTCGTALRTTPRR